MVLVLFVLQVLRHFLMGLAALLVVLIRHLLMEFVVVSLALL